MNETGTLADLLRSLRNDARLSQEALAERAGLSARTVSDIECGAARSPRAITLSLLAEALGLDEPGRDRLRAAARDGRVRAPARQSELPLPDMALIGRERECTACVAALVDDRVRLLSLVGGAGFGKTALAYRVARDAAHAFDAVAVAELAAVNAAELVPATIALALGVRAGSRPDDPAATAAAIEGRRTLLVIDNLEHVAAALPFVEALLKAAPGLQVIATSRFSLRVPSEREIPVAPLDPATSAIDLLVERVRAARPDFDPANERKGGLEALSRLLHGVPLAIELTAPLVAVLPAATLAKRFGAQLGELSSGRDDQPARHRTMGDAIAWTHELLGDDERRAFRRLAALAGTFSVRAAQEVIGGAAGPADTLSTLRTLARLMDRSLLRAVREDRDEPQFEFLAFVRDYALVRLEESGEQEDVFLGLVRHCTAVATIVRLRDPQGQTRENVETLAAEDANFRAALDWLRTEGRIEPGLRLAFSLWAYWWLRGAYVEGLGHLTALLQQAERREGAVDDVLLADAYCAATGLAEACGRLTARSAFYEKAIALKRRLGDRSSIANLLSGEGVVASQLGDYGRARALLGEAAQIRRELGLPFDLAKSLADVGQNEANAGEAAAAAAAFEESLRFFREAGNELGVGIVFQLLAITATRAQDLERAEIFSRESLAIAQRAGHTATAGVATATLGRIALRRGRLDEARRCFAEALSLFGTAGEFQELPDMIEYVAELEHADGNEALAARLLGAAAATRQRQSAVVLAAELVAHEKLVAGVRAALGSAYDAEYAVGEAAGAYRVLAERTAPAD